VETGTVELPTLFEIEVGKTSLGADISGFSQFEEEKEYLYGPLAHLQLLDKPRFETVAVSTLHFVVDEGPPFAYRSALVSKGAQLCSQQTNMSSSVSKAG
jgi:hypothetical protein